MHRIKMYMFTRNMSPCIVSFNHQSMFSFGARYFRRLALNKNCHIKHKYGNIINTHTLIRTERQSYPKKNTVNFIRNSYL